MTLQNGLGNAERLQARLPMATVVAGITMAGAMIAEPGTVVHTGMGPTLLAETPQMSARARDLALLEHLLSDAGFNVEVVRDERAIEAVTWTKLLMNAAINPVTAWLNLRNGEALSRPDALKAMDGTWRLVPSWLELLQGYRMIRSAIWHGIREVVLTRCMSHAI